MSISILACRNDTIFIKMNRKIVENLGENLLQLTIFKLPHNLEKCFKVHINPFWKGDRWLVLVLVLDYIPRKVNEKIPERPTFREIERDI